MAAKARIANNNWKCDDDPLDLMVAPSFRILFFSGCDDWLPPLHRTLTWIYERAAHSSVASKFIREVWRYRTVVYVNAGHAFHLWSEQMERIFILRAKKIPLTGSIHDIPPVPFTLKILKNTWRVLENHRMLISNLVTVHYCTLLITNFSIPCTLQVQYCPLAATKEMRIVILRVFDWYNTYVASCFLYCPHEVIAPSRRARDQYRFP